MSKNSGFEYLHVGGDLQACGTEWLAGLRPGRNPAVRRSFSRTRRLPAKFFEGPETFSSSQRLLARRPFMDLLPESSKILRPPPNLMDSLGFYWNFLLFLNVEQPAGWPAGGRPMAGSRAGWLASRRPADGRQPRAGRPFIAASWQITPNM